MSVVSPGRYVLLVDDDPVILRGYGQRLRTEGYEVTTAADGYEALTALSQRTWDLIILDLRLPYRNGIEVLRVLRTRKESATTPVYVLAQPGDADFVDRAMREGADGVFEKARIAPRDLVLEVEAILDGRRGSARPDAASSIGASHGSPVPQAVDEIARRFRRDPPTASRPGVAPPSSVRSPRASYQDVESPGIPAAAPAPRHATQPIPTAPGSAGTTARPAGGFDVVLNRMVGQPGPLAAALGLPTDYSCPICAGSLVLRLEPDVSIEFGVRGHFYCPRCMQ